jgi:hypothetical protein
MTTCNGSSTVPVIHNASVLFGGLGGSYGDVAITVSRPTVNSTALGDLDGDGRADLVTSSNDNSVSVMISAGGGTFAPRVDYPAGSAPRRVTLGDLDGDGRLDIVVPNSGSSSVSVWLGTGGGAFGARHDSPSGGNPYAVAIGDLDGDTRPDLAVANYGANQASVLMGNGDGTFAAPVGYAVDFDPAGIAIGDLNGDTYPDLATAHDFGSTNVLYNNGSGTFGNRRNFPGGRSPVDVAIGDLDRDGKLDIVLANHGFSTLTPESTVTVLIADDVGGFEPGVLVESGTASNRVVLADLNEDGLLDVVTSDDLAATVSTLTGNGDGTFHEKVGFGSTGSNAVGVSVGDVDADGLPDIAMANSASGTVTVLLQRNDLPTSTLLQLFTATPGDQGIEVRWRLGGPAPRVDLALERSEGVAAAWARIGRQPRIEGGDFVLIDDTAQPGHDYRYRLSGSIEGRRLILGSIEVRVPSVSALALFPIVPSPAHAEAHVAYSLDRDTNVRLSVCDVQGRVLSVLDQGVRTAGRHEVTWPVRIDGHPAPPGVYFVTLEASGQRRVGRLVALP